VPTLRVIVINYNAGEGLRASVEAVLSEPGSFTLVVADNASNDDSLNGLEDVSARDPRLVLRRNPENIGFARAVNREARQASEDYLLILNPDCILQAGAIQALIDALEADPKAALAGPWVTDHTGAVQKGTWRHLPNFRRSLMAVSGLHRFSGRAAALEGIDLPGRGPPDNNTVAEAVSGACMMIRRTAGAPVGFFDEAYAMHCEDLDLMYRLGAQGFHCLLVPAARAVHVGGVSSASRPWWVHRQKHLGMQRYYRKFQAGEHTAPVRWLILAGIWGHYLLTLPVVWLKRVAGSA
jgi:GT2 family glycosyltransferase